MHIEKPWFKLKITVLFVRFVLVFVLGAALYQNY